MAASAATPAGSFNGTLKDSPGHPGRRRPTSLKERMATTNIPCRSAPAEEGKPGMQMDLTQR